MGANICNTEASAVLNVRFVPGSTYTAPTGLVAALHTADPGPTDTPASEVSGGSYARQTLSFGASSGGNPCASNVALTWSNLPACTVTWFLIWNNPTAGARPVTRGAFASPIAVAAGQGLTIPAGSLTVGIT